MATFTFSLAIGAQTFTYTETITNANAQRIGLAYRSILGLPGATDQQIWAKLGEGVADTIKTRVVNQERDSQTAAIMVEPLT